MGDFPKLRPLVKGKDLAELGLKGGPVYKEIFKEVLFNKLDGELKTKKEEINFIKKRYLPY